jgi:glycosyltransferase involved in cell wall biosynthesis
MKTRVSVLLPVFNAEKTLPEALDSLLAQTLSDFEIIAVDDGSTDGSTDLLFAYAKKDKRVKVITRDHQGIVPTLKTAFEQASAPYLARMDADDVCLPDRFKLQAELLDERSDIAVVGCLVGPVPGEAIGGGYIEYFRWINELVEPDQIADNVFVESPMAHPSVMFRRGPYTSIGGYQDHRWPEDYDLWLRMHLAGYRFAKVPQVLVQWRDYPGRTSRRNPRYDVDAFFEAKAFYLAQGPLKGVEKVVIWGAGRTTRQRAAFLHQYGVEFSAYVDVDPKKIGHVVHGVPVISPEDLTQYDSNLILPFVAKWGAREDIRERLIAMGKVEGKDFICCA